MSGTSPPNTDPPPFANESFSGSSSILLVDRDVATSVTCAVIKPLSGGDYVLCWCAVFRNTSFVRSRVLSAAFEPVREDIVITVERPWVAVDAVALVEGGYALTWNDRDRIYLRTVDGEGAASRPIALAKFTVQIPELTVKQFPGGEIAVSWQEGLVIMRPGDAVLLVAVSPDAWHNAIELISKDCLLRVDTGREQSEWRGVPIYTVNGAFFSSAAQRVGDFHYKVPTKIVTDTYSHPQHLRALAQGEGFLLMWTDLAYHKNNAIQAVLFDRDGKPCRTPIILVQASAEAHVERASFTPLVGGGLLVAWSHDHGMGYNLMAQSFSSGLSPTSPPITLASGEMDDGGSINVSGDGQLMALWNQQGRIYLKLFNLPPPALRRKR